MSKCECPIDGSNKRKIADSSEQSKKRVRPGQDLQSDAAEGQQLGHESGSSGSMGPMELVVEVDAGGGDLGRQHDGGQ
eukprot:5452802-Heterocapsa_arctica.AAC.1